MSLLGRHSAPRHRQQSQQLPRCAYNITIERTGWCEYDAFAQTAAVPAFPRTGAGTPGRPAARPKPDGPLRQPGRFRNAALRVRCLAHPAEHFFVRTHIYKPKVELAEWRLRVDGLIERELALDMAQIEKLPRVEQIGRAH